MEKDNPPLKQTDLPYLIVSARLGNNKSLHIRITLKRVNKKKPLVMSDYRTAFRIKENNTNYQ